MLHNVNFYHPLEPLPILQVVAVRNEGGRCCNGVCHAVETAKSIGISHKFSERKILKAPSYNSIYNRIIDEKFGKTVHFCYREMATVTRASFLLFIFN